MSPLTLGRLATKRVIYLATKTAIYLVCFLCFDYYVFQRQPAIKGEFEKHFYEKVVKCGDNKFYTRSKNAKEYYELSDITISIDDYGYSKYNFVPLFTNAEWLAGVEVAFKIKASCHMQLSSDIDPLCNDYYADQRLSGQVDKYMWYKVVHASGESVAKLEDGYRAHRRKNEYLSLDRLERPTCEDAIKQVYFEF